MNLKNIKAITFDYDLTLYTISAEYNNIWDNYSKKMLSILFKDLGENVKNNFIKKYDLYQDITIERTSRALLNEYGDCSNLISYLMNTPYEQDYKNMTYVNPSTIQKLAKKFNLYITSNAPSNNIYRQLEKNANIDPKLFQDIYTNPHLANDPTKAYLYKKIIKRENITPEQLLVVGDNPLTDIKPAKDVGASTLLIKSVDEINNLI